MGISKKIHKQGIQKRSLLTPVLVGVILIAATTVILVSLRYSSRGFWSIAAQPLATAFTGAGAITAACLILLNGHLSRRQEDEHHRQVAERETEIALRDRYTTIASQLADGSPAVRMAGVYALVALSDDWHAFGNSQERRICIDLLRAYIRVPMPQQADTSVALSGAGEREVRQSIVRSIAYRRQLSQDDDRSWSSITTTFWRSILPGCALQDCKMQGWQLTGADFTGASLAGADLSGAILRSARLVHVDLNQANLREADLKLAELAASSFRDADLTNADLSSADLSQANFTGALLRGAKMRGTKLREANLSNADLTGADLRAADLTGVIYSSHTRWPEDFAPLSQSGSAIVRPTE
ncbi:pentapeptide repeat-containing protein [Nocardia asiatica]|uniref:pentapeptide repeat-containing protein n=1 Tax=Nocardia asiatica TaxID=209252 RepID=UPI003EE28760